MAEHMVLAVVCVVLAVLGMRYWTLKKALKDTCREVHEISRQVEENRIVKLAVPDRDLEELLREINKLLESIRRKQIYYRKQEKEFQQEIENISHDLRTPLTSIIGYLKMVEPDGLSQEDRQALEVVQRKTEFLQRLITQFYEHSRLTGGDYELKQEQVDLGRVLREHLADHYEELAACGLQVETDIPHEPFWVCGDPDACERIIANLLRNSEKYGESFLRAGICRKESAVVLSIENDAEGLSEEQAQRLFDRFYRTDLSRSDGSTGLGLTISKQLAQKMGGQLEAVYLGEHKVLRMELTFPLA